ncbi:MAG: GntR family transcriptional regulator [Halioglobus sp.]|nr:GntR family transcriptional regulator [Halioglobus sp.]
MTKQQKTLVSSEPGMSLAEHAYQELQLRIITLQLKPGVMLSEKTLSEDLGLGRSPVREALQKLEREQLVEVHSRRGARVTELDVLTQLNLLEVRRSLDVLAAKASAVRASEDERLLMLQYAAQLRAAAGNQQNTDVMRVLMKVHALEASAAHNRVLLASLELLQPLSRRFWYSRVQSADTLLKGADLHARLLESIAHRQPDQAAANALELIDYLEHLARTSFESIAVEPGP